MPMDKVQIEKRLFQEIVELLESFQGAAMSSYYSSDLHLQADDKRTDEILRDLRDQGVLD